MSAPGRFSVPRAAGALGTVAAVAVLVMASAARCGAAGGLPAGAGAHAVAAAHAVPEGMRNAKVPLAGVLTGGQPDSAAVVALAADGWRTVVDLRTPAEDRGFDEPGVARAAGLRYVALPVGHHGPADSTFARMRELLADSTLRPIVVHCASGNRVGSSMIPWLVLDRGLAPDSALALARTIGMRDLEAGARALEYAKAMRDSTGRRPER